MRQVLTLGVAAILAATLAAASQFAPVRGREYREFFNAVNPVRGEAIVGLAAVPEGDPPRSRAIDVWIPERFSGELQVEALTADGRFRGEGAFTGSTSGAEWVSLPLTTPGAADPSSRPGDSTTLALAVRGPASTLFVARWGQTAREPTKRIRVYVNSRRADVFVRAGSNVTRCVPLTIPQPLRFDAYCDLDTSTIPADGRLTLIRRDQFDEQTQSFTVNARDVH